MVNSKTYIYANGGQYCTMSLGRGPGNGGGWPSGTGNPSGGGRSNR